MKDKLSIVKLWIKKANNDLITAENSLNIKPEPPVDTIGFHAQQCAEKCLKAFLMYHEKEFGKTHNLGDLIALCIEIDDEFEKVTDVADKLTPYAVEIRYPGILEEEITIEHAKEALEISKKIRAFVLNKLPEEVKK